jgi:hypothetical protein
VDPRAEDLTLLYDPVAPSPFLLEAFSPDELGLESAADVTAVRWA